MRKRRAKKSGPSERRVQSYLDSEVRRTMVVKDQAKRKVVEEINKLVAKMEASGKLTDEHRLGLGLPPKCWDNIASEEESPPNGL